MPLVDAVLASAATSTYFWPWTIAGIGELVAGGIGVAGDVVYHACIEAFHFTDAYESATTQVVSLGMGDVCGSPPPRWLGSWLGWLLSEFLRSRAEQQTELVHRHYPKTSFHRLDVDLDRDIGLDAVDQLDELKAIGERLAPEIDWPRLLANRDERFPVTADRTLPRAYCRLPRVDR